MSEAKTKKRAKANPAALPPTCDVLLGREQVCSAIGGISTRTFERMLSAREFPVSDTHVGVRPMWRVATINRWIESKCQPGG